MQIVSFSGKARVGKDTAANFLVENYGFKKIGFADELKNHMLALNPVIRMDEHDIDSEYCYTMNLRPLIELYGWEFAKETYPDVRKLLQNYGTEVVRNNFDDNIWIDLLFRKAEKLKIDRLVISDTRFRNELQAVCNKNGLLIKIKSSRLQSTDNHLSEQDLDDSYFDQVINNDTDIADFLIDVNRVMDIWLKKEK